MLVSFSVQNFRSFASRQTISMVAGVGAKRDDKISFPSGNSIAPHLLRSVCLFGSNGAGKSALVYAFDFFRDFVISSAKDKQEGEKIDVSGFKLSADWKGQPSEFEATFIHEDALYQYGFAVDGDRVWSEWLFSKPNSPKNNIRTIFQREFDEASGEYIWNINRTHVRGEKELWKRSTRDNALFLSTAISLKAEIFSKPFNWIQKYLRVVGSLDRVSPDFTAHQCVEAGWKDKIVKFLQAIDVKVKDLSIDVRDIDVDELLQEEIPESLRKDLTKKFAGFKFFDVEYIHKIPGEKPVSLNLREESDGTQVLFSISGPWLDVLESGYTLIVDELHNSLHPHAVRFLVNMFHDPEINTNNAQLIFTTHETSVMAKEFMHPDQVWFIEKDDAESSKLVPLSDYKVREGSSFQKSYLDGRYGAVPILKEFVNA